MAKPLLLSHPFPSNNMITAASSALRASISRKICSCHGGCAVDVAFVVQLLVTFEQRCGLLSLWRVPPHTTTHNCDSMLFHVSEKDKPWKTINIWGLHPSLRHHHFWKQWSGPCSYGIIKIFTMPESFESNHLLTCPSCIILHAHCGKTRPWRNRGILSASCSWDFGDVWIPKCFGVNWNPISGHKKNHLS